jgi:hypothetical protein
MACSLYFTSGKVDELEKVTQELKQKLTGEPDFFFHIKDDLCMLNRLRTSNVHFIRQDHEIIRYYICANGALEDDTTYQSVFEKNVVVS